MGQQHMLTDVVLRAPPRLWRQTRCSKNNKDAGERERECVGGRLDICTQMCPILLLFQAAPAKQEQEGLGRHISDAANSQMMSKGMS